MFLGPWAGVKVTLRQNRWEVGFVAISHISTKFINSQHVNCSWLWLFQLDFIPAKEILLYTLFDGLTCNTCRYFASCMVFSKCWRGEEKKIQAMSKMSACIMLKHRIRGLLFHYKTCYFCLYFLVKVFKNIVILCVNDVHNMESHLNARVQFGHCCLRLLHPYNYARPVVNRLNQDTTVNYALIFCACS